MARTYGHPDSTRNAQPSQHRNTLKVQDALRSISNGDKSSRSHISKDDFLDFIASFPRLYRVGGVIGGRLGQWLAENEALVRSWDREINQLQPGFFRSKEEDEDDGVELPAPGHFVRREDRGLPESFAEDASASKKVKARRDSREAAAGRDNQSRPLREVPLRNSRRGAATMPRLADLDDGEFGTPLDPSIPAKFPAFTGLSVEQFVLRTAYAAQHDMDKVRHWFQSQRQVLDPADALVDKFLKLESELPRYDEFVGAANMIAELAKARDAENMRKEEEAKKPQKRSQDARAKADATSPLGRASHTGLANPFAGDEADEDDYGENYSRGDSLTPSKSPTSRAAAQPQAAHTPSLGSHDRMDIDGVEHSTDHSAEDPAHLAEVVKKSITAAAGDPIVSEPSDLSTGPHVQSSDSSRRVSATDLSESQMLGSAGETDWHEDEERHAMMQDLVSSTDGSFQARQGSQRKRKRTQKAIESSEADYESEE